jgi:predicted  nucleic acid-binding Zn-ribbon protein
VASGTDQQRLKALHDELETWHRRAKAELNRLCELESEDDEEWAKLKEAYDRCFEQHQKVAWEIHVLLFPERYRDDAVEPDDA